MRIIRKHEVREMVGLSDPTIWRMERAGAFPHRLRIGKNAVGYYFHEIEEWIQNLPREGGQAVPLAAGGASR